MSITICAKQKTKFRLVQLGLFFEAIFLWTAMVKRCEYDLWFFSHYTTACSSVMSVVKGVGEAANVVNEVS